MTDGSPFGTRRPVPAISESPLRAAAPGLLFGTATVALFGAYKGLLSVSALYPSGAALLFLAVLTLSAVSSSVTYARISPSLRSLARGLAIACGLYSAFLYPSIPVFGTRFAGFGEALILGAYAVAMLAAIAAWFRPSWLFVCAYYVFWIKNVAGYLTGLSYHNILDVLPLFQMPAYASLAIVALQLIRRLPAGKAIETSTVDPQKAILFIAIAMQAANYFAAGQAKAMLDGGPLEWPLHNENVNILLVALYNKQLLWGEFGGLADFAVQALSAATRPVAVLIFLAQLAALFAFANRRLMLALFAFLDLMHVGIFVLAGPNFWPWFMINLAIIAAVSRLPGNAFNWRTGAAGAALIVAAPVLVEIFPLGWYDTTAVNSMRFEVVEESGKQTRVPSTYFGFYSYPVAHMSFGLPPGNYVPTLTNGGTLSSAVRKQADRCDFGGPTHSEYKSRWNPEAVTGFIRSYHDYVLQRVGSDGKWSYDLYAHHFWSAPSVIHQFSFVDIRKVVAYRMVVDSVCLSRDRSHPRLLYRNEYQIDVNR